MNVQQLNKHINAFTMMDVLMGMAIMSLVVAMSYVVLTNTLQQLYVFGSSRFELSQHIIHQQDLKRQFLRAEKIIETNTGFNVIQKDQSIEFTFKEYYIIRKMDHQEDTLFHQVNQLQKQFYENSSNNSAEKLIEEITLESKMDELIFTSRFYKNYDNTNKINQALIREFKN